MQLTAENVFNTMRDCMFLDGEDKSNAVIVDRQARNAPRRNPGYAFATTRYFYEGLRGRMAFYMRLSG